MSSASTNKPWLDDGKPITVRRARSSDRDALGRLAVLDGSPPLRGEVLVAEVEGELRAAIELVSGRAVADPFRPSTLARDLLALRARRLRGVRTRLRRPWQRLWRGRALGTSPG